MNWNIDFTKSVRWYLPANLPQKSNLMSKDSLMIIESWLRVKVNIERKNKRIKEQRIKEWKNIRKLKENRNLL